MARARCIGGDSAAAGAAFGACSILELFHGISASGGGVASMTTGLHAVNRPLMVAFAAAAVFAAALFVAWSFKPEKSRDFLDVILSALVLIAAGVSSLLLWRIENLTIDVTTDRITMTIAEAWRQLAFLVMGGFFGPLLLCGGLATRPSLQPLARRYRRRST